MMGAALLFPRPLGTLSPEARVKLADVLTAFAADLAKGAVGSGETTLVELREVAGSEEGVACPRPVIVGFGGRAGAGKDTAASWLVEHAGFTRIGLADALKAEVLDRFPRTLAALATLCWSEGLLGRRWSMPPYLVDSLLVAKPLVLRTLYQEYGTEVRRADDPTYWLTRWTAQALRYPRVVVPDVRFDNEVVWLRALGARLVFVERPGLPAPTPDVHVSERLGPAPFDAVLHNDDTLATLRTRVAAWWEASWNSSPGN